MNLLDLINRKQSAYIQLSKVTAFSKTYGKSGLWYLKNVENKDYGI